MSRLSLPDVTLIAASSIALPQTIAALARSVALVDFASVKLLTSESVDLPFDAQVIAVPPIRSRTDYSDVILHILPQHVHSRFVQIVQWDGFVLDPGAWTDAFLDYDYVGAVWPQFDDDHCVGNGGFSLRSARLMAALSTFDLPAGMPEDITVCRQYRTRLEQDHAIAFAPRELAERYSYERGRIATPSFGFHGSFNLARAVGYAQFREIVSAIDPRALGHRERTDALRIAWARRDWRLTASLLAPYRTSPALRAYLSTATRRCFGLDRHA